MKLPALLQSKSHRNVILLIAVPFFAAGGAVKVFHSLQQPEREKFLIDCEPLVLWLCLALVVAGVVKAFPHIAAHLREADRGLKRKLLAVLLFALIVRAFVAPWTHRLYFDEDIYLSIAQNMASEGKAAATNFAIYRWDDYKLRDGFLNKQPNGYPAMISLVFMVFGVSEKAATVLSIALSSLTPLLLFLLVQKLCGDRAALWASLFQAMQPVAAAWATSASTETPLAFTVCLVLYLLCLFDEKGDYYILAAAAAGLALAVQIRPEAVLVLTLVPFFLVHGRRTLGQAVQYPVTTIIMMILCLLLFCHVIHMLHFIDNSWGADEGGKFSIGYLSRNAGPNFGFFAGNRDFPFFFLLLAVLGIFAGKTLVRNRIFLLCWWALFFLPYLFFYAGSYRYGVDVRFVIPALCPVSALCGLGAEKVQQMLSAVFRSPFQAVLAAVAVLFLPFLPFIRTVHEEAWQARFDHQFITREAALLPQDSIIFSHSPYVITVNSKRGALQSYFGSSAEKVGEVFSLTDHVYFYRDYWCFAKETEQNFNYFNEHFKLTRQSAEKMYDREYALYKVELNQPTDTDRRKNSSDDTKCYSGRN